jgi:hypothetical protein
MKYHLEWPTELQAVERKFLLEIEDLEKEFIYKNMRLRSTALLKRR